MIRQLLIVFTIFEFARSTYAGEKCDLGSIKDLPVIFVTGEAHAEKVNLMDVKLDSTTEESVRDSTEMRSLLFEYARAGKFALASEIYQPSSKEGSGPFFSRLKDREDSEKEIYGIESDEAIALHENYLEIERYYLNDERRPESTLTSFLYDTLRFDSDLEAWQATYRNQENNSLINQIKPQLTSLIEEISKMRKDPGVLKDAQLRKFSGDVKERINKMIENRFNSKEQTEALKTLVKSLHNNLVNIANSKMAAKFPTLTAADVERDTAVSDLIEKVNRTRDNTFVSKFLEPYCSAAKNGRHYFVVNMGGAHVEGFVSELTRVSNAKFTIKKYFTYKKEDLVKLKADLATIVSSTNNTSNSTQTIQTKK